MRRSIIMGLIIGFVIIIGVSMILIFSGCASLSQELKPAYPRKIVREINLGYTEKLIVHVDAGSGKIINFECEGGGYSTSKDEDKITVEPIQEN